MLCNIYGVLFNNKRYLNISFCFTLFTVKVIIYLNTTMLINRDYRSILFMFWLLFVFIHKHWNRHDLNIKMLITILSYQLIIEEEWIKWIKFKYVSNNQPMYLFRVAIYIIILYSYWNYLSSYWSIVHFCNVFVISYTK